MLTATTGKEAMITNRRSTVLKMAMAAQAGSLKSHSMIGCSARPHRKTKRLFSSEKKKNNAQFIIEIHTKNDKHIIKIEK